MSAAPGVGGPDLSGRLQLRPGAPVPHNLRSTRRLWAAQIAPGRPADALPGLLAGLFSLCGHAHRTASQLAIGAALPGLLPALQTVPALLQRETAVEHLRRIALDWPRLLAAPADAATVAAQAGDSLRRCPLLAPARAHDDLPWPALRQWLQQECLQMSPADWHQAWLDGGPDWLDGWSRRHGGWLPGLLRALRTADSALPGDAHAAALLPHARQETLRALGASLALHEGFALRPRWQGRVACTGPWARLHTARQGRPWTAWGLLGSRLAELVRLSLPDAPGPAGAGTLAWGSLSTGPRQGLAWVEMARGLLIHQVLLDDAVAGRAPVVRACQVLAPTEWNFHPEGLVAQALAALPADGPGLHERVGLLMAAFDPCVSYEMLAPATQQRSVEGHHA